jgi:hypothetical protein
MLISSELESNGEINKIFIWLLFIIDWKIGYLRNCTHASGLKDHIGIRPTVADDGDDDGYG